VGIACHLGDRRQSWKNLVLLVALKLFRYSCPSLHECTDLERKEGETYLGFGFYWSAYIHFNPMVHLVGLSAGTFGVGFNSSLASNYPKSILDRDFDRKTS
jgi:hypothetical protein